MVVEIRLYKKNDMDLVALADAGCSIPAMMQEAVIAYANGIPFHLLIDEIVPFDKNGKQTIHTRFTIPDSEANAVFLMKNIKSGCRNSFCKLLLRNALIQQNLSGFFARNELLQLQAQNSRHINPSVLQNVKICSNYKVARQVSFAGKTFEKQQAAPAATISYSPPSFQMPFQTAGQAFSIGGATFNPYAGMPVGFYPGIQPSPAYSPGPQTGADVVLPLPNTEVPKSMASTVGAQPMSQTINGSSQTPSKTVNATVPPSNTEPNIRPETSVPEKIPEAETPMNPESETTQNDSEGIGFADNDALFALFDSLQS